MVNFYRLDYGKGYAQDCPMCYQSCCVKHDSFWWIVVKSPPSIIKVECIFIYMWLSGTKFQLVQTKNWCHHTIHAKTYYTWHIVWTWLLKPWPHWACFPILKACFNLCVNILFTTLSNIFKPPSWLNFTNAKVIKSWKTSRFIGSWCYHGWKKSWMNIRSWLLRWLKKM